MNTTQTGTPIIEGDDEYKMVQIEETWGMQAILQFVEDSLQKEKEYAKVQEDKTSAQSFMRLENKVRRVILAFQKEGLK